jgi:hypothetical protein
MPNSKDLLGLRYETFCKQNIDTKLDTLFVMMSDMGDNHCKLCAARLDGCSKRFDRLESSRKWDKLYAAIGGGVAAVAVLFGKLFIWGK